MLKYCYRCGTYTPADACPLCGSPLSAGPDSPASSPTETLPPPTKKTAFSQRSRSPLFLLVVLALAIWFLAAKPPAAPVPSANPALQNAIDSGYALAQAEKRNQERAINAVMLRDAPTLPGSTLYTDADKTDVFGNRYTDTLRIPCNPGFLGSDGFSVCSISTDGRYAAFHATLFCEPRTQEDATVFVQLTGDGYLLWEKELNLRTRPIPLLLDISGVQTLRLNVSANGRGGLVLANAFLD